VIGRSKEFAGKRKARSHPADQLGRACLRTETQAAFWKAEQKRGNERRDGPDICRATALLMSRSSSALLNVTRLIFPTRMALETNDVSRKCYAEALFVFPPVLWPAQPNNPAW
jgi:hypothetical protein